jgi:hypothetical protein
MTRADWMAAERAFDRREELPKEYEMGQGRWSKWSVGGEERHTLEFGFAYRFDVRAGPRSNGLHPDFWYASARAGSLGEFPTFGAAAQACEDEARRLIEEALQRGDASYDMKLIGEQWTLYLALPGTLLFVIDAQRQSQRARLGLIQANAELRRDVAALFVATATDWRVAADR